MQQAIIGITKHQIWLKGCIGYENQLVQNPLFESLNAPLLPFVELCLLP